MNGSESSLNDVLPTFRFRLKRFEKAQNVPHFDHWKIPLRIIFFITQTERCDGLYHLQYCMIPEDCHIILFDETANAASVILDYGQNGKDKPFVRTPLEILEKTERLNIVQDNHPHNIVLFIKKLAEICPPDITFVLVNITPDEETLESVMQQRTLLIKHFMVDILEIMATTMPEEQQKRLHKLVHDCCSTLQSIPENDDIYSRCFARQMALQKCNFPLGLLFSYLVRIRIFGLSPECPTSNDMDTDPYGYRLISLVFKVQSEFLEKAVYMIQNRHRMRIPSLPPLPKETTHEELPHLYDGDVTESHHNFELKKYPEVIKTDTNFISEFQMYCSTRHLPMPIYTDQARTVQGENPWYSVSITTHNRTFQSQAVFADKKTAKSEATKLAMVELGLLRLSPKAFKVMQLLAPGDKVQLFQSTDASTDFFKSNAKDKPSSEINPVSMVGEFCSKRNFPQPEYTAITEHYSASAIMFRVSAYLFNHSATSNPYNSKRAAKRDAAEKLLKLLQPLYSEIEEVESNASTLLPSLVTTLSQASLPTTATHLTPASTMEEGSTVSKDVKIGLVEGGINAIEALFIFCAKKNIALPSFTYTEIHGANLMFKAKCSIPALNIEVQAPDAYKSKKEAKHAVSKLAYKACKELVL